MIDIGAVGEIARPRDRQWMFIEISSNIWRSWRRFFERRCGAPHGRRDILPHWWRENVLEASSRHRAGTRDARRRYPNHCNKPTWRTVLYIAKSAMHSTTVLVLYYDTSSVHGSTSHPRLCGELFARVIGRGFIYTVIEAALLPCIHLYIASSSSNTRPTHHILNPGPREPDTSVGASLQAVHTHGIEGA